MAVFRIERTRDYTIMANHHLRNCQLSLKAKGLLSMMLSLPDGWNYTVRGLATIRLPQWAGVPHGRQVRGRQLCPDPGPRAQRPDAGRLPGHGQFSHCHPPYENQSAESELLYCKLEYATDTKIIRFKKIVAEANPFDEYWTDYFEEREGEKLLNSTKGREKLLTIWRRQHRRCPVCGDLITSETGFKVHTPAGKNSRKIMVHKECHKEIHSLITAFEPGSR